MIHWLKSYLRLPSTVWWLCAGLFLTGSVQMGFLHVLNVYMSQLGHSDARIAELSSYRFISVFFLSVPLGLFLRGRRLKPVLLAGALSAAVFSVVLLEALSRNWSGVLDWIFLASGLSMVLLNVSAMPYLLRASSDDNLSESVSLNAASASFAGFASGLAISVLTPARPVTVLGIEIAADPYFALMAISVASFLALYCFARLPELPSPPELAKTPGRRFWHLDLDYDWRRILIVSAPTLVIAVGAGLAIPFINLFFHSVFKMSAGTFGAFGGLAQATVFLASLAIPLVRRRYGWHITIVGSQGLAIVMLAGMSLSELLADNSWAVWVALICFLLRTPLMQMAGPATAELTVSYVGGKNREIIGTLNGTIWSGSWYVSAKLFELMRSHGMPYWQIFLITVVMYAAGTTCYAFIIRSYERRLARDEAAVGIPASDQA